MGNEHARTSKAAQVGMFSSRPRKDSAALGLAWGSFRALLRARWRRWGQAAGRGAAQEPPWVLLEEAFGCQVRPSGAAAALTSSCLGSQWLLEKNLLLVLNVVQNPPTHQSLIV